MEFEAVNDQPIVPLYVTDSVNYDSDDPAIWIHPTDPSKSLILGTDKKGDREGGLFAFDLKGKMDTSLIGFDRPNNVDVGYGLIIGEDTLDIAVVSERIQAKIRVVSLPDMQYIDGGGIPVFEDDDFNEVMGIALYKRPVDNTFFAIVSRKENPDNDNDYLYQYQLIPDSSKVSGKLVRKFGNFSGKGEIEAIAVDHELGYIYYSDESFAVRKYHADPDLGNEELASFGLDGFLDDREGISIYKTGSETGYIIVSDQEDHEFHLYSRQGTAQNPHEHQFLGAVELMARFSDGSEVTHLPLNQDFPNGMFVAMSDNKTFEIYSWDQIARPLNLTEPVIME
jgi:3-phytase